MNREIEFRAWDKNIEVMLYGMPYLALESLGFDQLAKINQSRFILMQCTGLKDKNGKKIFENDLLKDTYGHILKVIFKGGCFRAIDRAYNCECEGSEFSGFYKNNKTDFIIIGNIYENPERS